MYNLEYKILQQSFDLMDDYIFTKDLKGRYTFANKKVCDLFHQPLENVVGKDDTHFFDLHISQDILRNDREVLSQEKTIETIETNIIKQTHETKYYKSIKKPLYDDNQKVIGLFGISIDITSEQRVSSQLQEKDRLLRIVLDENPSIILVKDYEGKFLLVNKAVATLYQANPEDMIGKDDGDYIPKEQADFFRKNIQEIMDKEETSLVYEDSTDVKTGEIRHFQSIKKPLKDKDGNKQILVIATDVTHEKRQAEQIKKQHKKLKETQKRFKMAAECISDLIYEWEVLTNKLTWFSDVDSFLGYQKGEISNDINNFFKLIHPNDIPILTNAIELHKSSSSPIDYKYRVKHYDGKYRYWHKKGLPLLNTQGKPYRWVGVCTDITDQMAYQSQLEHIAHYDPLTNLANRLLLTKHIEYAILQAQRDDTLVAIVYLDLDGFKEINDTYGHDMGDAFLLALSIKLKDVLGEKDTLARLGGDEFVAVIPHLMDRPSIEPILEKLLYTASQAISINENILHTSASIGVTYYQDEEVDCDQLIRQADQAMYQAKESGKNCYFTFDNKHAQIIREQHKHIESIKLALHKKEFILYYQPKVNMRTGKVIGVEALIRWRHPKKGILPPSAFLPYINNHSLIIEIGDWVIETALMQIELWNKIGLELSVSVNVDALQLAEDNFVDNIAQKMKRYPCVKKGQLDLEILETSALTNIDDIANLIEKCKTIGVYFSLDDFGTGYSSLTYLKRIPARELKIDCSFVRDMLTDEDDRAIVEGIIQLSQTFKLDVIAEGVETLEHGVALLSLGCEMAQGYGIARPMDKQALPRWIKDWEIPTQWLN